MKLEAVVPFASDFEFHFAVFPFPSSRGYFQRGEILLVSALPFRAHQHEEKRLLAVFGHPRPERNAVPLAGSEAGGGHRIPPPAELVRRGGTVDAKRTVWSHMGRILTCNADWLRPVEPTEGDRTGQRHRRQCSRNPNPPCHRHRRCFT